ncbi:hypothetical protein NDU88_009428 [Pleurodeles waltl]|uniref:Uncharacterized protein n=1 Tax=Pleurodeles waltl TaxID=8319 RepID=A0AAV7QUJ8_PLEWA|nr:hypothetical protein NDU88_009428 [Pleurodeles waltl]
MAARIGMNHQDDEDSEPNRPVGQPSVEETKSLLVPKTAPRRTAPGSKKLYIHNYFTRARSGAGDGMEEGGEQAEPTICIDALVSKAPIIPLAPLPGTISASSSTRTEYTQEQDQGPKQEQEQDSSGYCSFGMGSSIIGELFELADTTLEEGWDSLNGRINDKNKNKNTACEGNRRSNMLLTSLEHEHEYEPEILGPTSTGGRDELEMGQGMTETLSANNRIKVVEVEVHQRNQSQVDVVQANKPMNNGQVCSIPLHDLLNASREWPAIAEQEGQDDRQENWPIRKTNMRAPGTGEGPKIPQEGYSSQNSPNKERVRQQDQIRL